MRFVDFLKATVLLCAGAATLLAALTIVGGAQTGEQVNTLIAVSSADNDSIHCVTRALGAGFASSETTFVSRR